MVQERQVRTEEMNRDQNIIKNTANPKNCPTAYIYGNLTPDSTYGNSAFKMYERNPISGYWSFVAWVPLDEVDENKDFIPEQFADYH
jgi:hypothetical protein